MTVGNLSAINANLGTVTAGIAQSADGKVIIDFDDKTFKVYDASSVLRVHIGYFA